MSKRPEIGDIVTIRGIVIKNHDTYCDVEQIDCEGRYFSAFAYARISSIEPVPPKVGDTVWYAGANYEGGTLLFIHGDAEEQADRALRKWGVVAYKGDLPRSFPLSEIRKTR